MNLQKDIQALNNKLDKVRRKLVAAKERCDQKIIFEARQEQSALLKQIESLKGAQSKQLSSKGAKLKAMPFHRAISKAEQADMGKLKKSVRGLVVVHPLTALGRELGVKEVTGFAFKKF